MKAPQLSKHPLNIAFDLCANLGFTGEVIWKVGKGIRDLNERLEYLRYALKWIETKAKDEMYKVPPVDFRTFVESEHLLNKPTSQPGSLYPEVLKCGVELNSGKYVEAVLTGAIGVGKCFGKGTPIMMFDGSIKPVEQVVVGDLLMGPDSKPRRVTSLARGKEEMFRVDQKGGESYVVNRSHILSLRYTEIGNRLGGASGNIRNITVDEYLALPEYHQKYLKGWMPKGVEFSEKEVRDPYFLGVWLGDGDSDNPTITTADPEILDELKAIAKKYGIILIDRPKYKPNSATRYRLCEFRRNTHENPVHLWLKRLGLYHNKHIPLEYKTASRKDRLELLAGIIDTDGCLTTNGCYEIVQKRRELINDIAFVARSLGFRTSLREKTVNGCVYYRLVLSGDIDEIPVRLPRKKASPRKQVKDVCRWGINLTSLGEGEYFGFTLEGPDRLFLLGDFTVAHNTHLGVYTQAYQLYVLTCMENPHATFDLDPASAITIIFQSINKDLAAEVGYAPFRALIDDSPYFQQYAPYDQGLKSEMRFINHRITVKPVTGAESGAIGQNVIGGIIDELNFMAVVENSKASHDGGTYDQAVKIYNTLARRRESRFMKLGQLPGMLCLSSSRNYPGQFTDKKEAEAREQIRRQGYTTIYVYDKRRWEIKPDEYCGKMFYVFKGDATRKPRILEDDEEVPPQDRHLVMPIPIEHRHAFEADLLPALRDIAGVATMALHPFILDTDAISACFGVVQSIASRDDCDFRDTKIKVFPKRIMHPQEPRFAHIDLAISRDSAGVSIGHVPGFKEMKRGDTVEFLPIIQFDMILEVRPPRGGEIEFENIRRLLYTLRDTIGLPIKWVSLDSFQSKDMMQILARQGFVTGYQSMDKDTYAYDVLKQALYDKRIMAPAHPKCHKELISLEFDAQKNKVDHPDNGSKDVADSVAGVVTGLTLRREIWVRHRIPMRMIPQSVLEGRSKHKGDITSKEREFAYV